MKKVITRSILSAILLMAGQVFAANSYWDSNGNTAGLGDTAGTWGTSAFWVALSGGNPRMVLLGTINTTATAPTASDAAYFGTVNLALGSVASTIGVGTATAKYIVFGAGQGSQGVTLSSGGTITIGSSGGIYANNTGANTIGAVLAGTTGMIKGGPGIIMLTGANTYTGTTTMNGGGTLTIGDGISGNLNNTTPSALTFSDGGGIFNVQSASAGSSQDMGALTFSTTGVGDGTVQSTYGTSGNAALTFSSLVARGAGATGNFVVSGGVNGTDNKIVLTGASTGFLDKGLYFGGSSYAAYDVTGYVRGLIYGTDANTVVADTITASSHVQLTSSPASRAGDTLLSLNLSGSGVDYTMSSGSLTVPAVLKSGGGSLSTISGGTSLTTAGNAELVIRTDTSSDLLTISSAVTGFSGGLTKTGAGTLTISGSNGYTGATRINAGTLVVSGGSAIADNQVVILADAAGSTLQLNNDETILNVTGGGFSGGNVNVQGNTLTLSSGSAYTFGGKFTGASGGGIIKQGAGKLTLSQTNGFAGTLTLEGGSIEFTYANDGTAPLIALSSGGPINLSGGTTLSVNPLATLPWGVFGSQLQAANGGSPAYPYGWTIANDITITSGTASFTIVGNENSVRFNGNVTGGASGSQTLSITTGNNQDREIVAFSGVVADGSSGTLGLTITSRAAQNGAYINLTNTNTFTGPIAMITTGNAPGYLVIGGERYGSAPTLITGAGSLGVGGIYSGAIDLSNTGAGLSILDYASSANQTLSGVISGGGYILKEGSGSLTLSAANTYAGGTQIAEGVLYASAEGALGVGNVTVSSTNGQLVMTAMNAMNIGATLNVTNNGSTAVLLMNTSYCEIAGLNINSASTSGVFRAAEHAWMGGIGTLYVGEPAPQRGTIIIIM